jgi:hypothetical protein
MSHEGFLLGRRTMLAMKERSQRKIYPIGYNLDGAGQYIDHLMAQPQMLLIDTRFSPKSRWAEWHEGTLRETYGTRYRTAGTYLGNVNFQRGPIQIADLEEGLRGLRLYLNEGHDLILLCQCSDYYSCHRKLIVDQLIEYTSVEVIQSGPIQRASATIMGLSIQQPYAQWLAYPGQFVNAGIRPKTIESRTWTTRYRGPLLLHASTTFDHDAIDYWIDRCPELEHVIPLEERAYTKGAFVGIAELIEVVHQSADPWFIGPYGFVLANACPLEPIPYRGQLKLFPAPVSLIQAQLTTTANKGDAQVVSGNLPSRDQSNLHPDANSSLAGDRETSGPLKTAFLPHPYREGETGTITTTNVRSSSVGESLHL